MPCNPKCGAMDRPDGMKVANLRAVQSVVDSDGWTN